MSKRILIIQGHPDAGQGHFGDALQEAYELGARDAGHELRRLTLAELDIPLLRSRADWESQPPPPDMKRAQEDILWAEHLVILYPLWMGDMPALLKAFFEQVLRPGFAMSMQGEGKPWARMLQGRSARVVVTMGMPAFAYRWFFRAHSLKSLERNILKLCGIAPVRASLVGMVEDQSGKGRRKELDKLRSLGKQAR